MTHFSFRRLDGFPRFPLFPRPTFFYDLPSAANRQSIFRHVFCDATRCADVRTFAHAHGGDQGAVAADEYSVVDDGGVLIHTVVVAGDGSGSDVDPGSDFSVAQIGDWPSIPCPALFFWSRQSCRRARLLQSRCPDADGNRVRERR